MAYTDSERLAYLIRTKCWFAENQNRHFAVMQRRRPDGFAWWTPFFPDPKAAIDEAMDLEIVENLFAEKPEDLDAAWDFIRRRHISLYQCSGIWGWYTSDDPQTCKSQYNFPTQDAAVLAAYRASKVTP